ncbi:MAG: chaperone modulator CbpM [Azonexus sp.]
MNEQQNAANWLDIDPLYPLETLAEISGLSIEEIDDLVSIGLIVPSATPAERPVFQLCHVLTVKKARRLRDDFQLDQHGVALALTLIRRIDELQTELATLRAGLRR